VRGSLSARVCVCGLGRGGFLRRGEAAKRHGSAGRSGAVGGVGSGLED
jgi:hypothetical protein